MTAGAGPLRVLVVDDEPAILRFLRAGLSAQGFVVADAQTGRQALDAIRRGATDMVVLDLGLPDVDGLDVIREVRKAGSAVPIIVLSSRDDETAKVAALDLGADDFVTKPFGIDELFARIRTAQRHRLQQSGERPLFRSGDLTVDLVRRVVTVRGEEVKFSRREYELLRLLVAHNGKVLTHRSFVARNLGHRDRRAISSHLHPGAQAEDRGLPRATRPHPDRDRGGLSNEGSRLTKAVRDVSRKSRITIPCVASQQ